MRSEGGAGAPCDPPLGVGRHWPWERDSTDIALHDAVDQVLVFIEGEGTAVIEGQRTVVGPDRLVLVPAGTRHNFINTGSSNLRLYTVYAPPQHAQGTIHRTKAEADADEHDQPAPPA